MSAAQVYWTVRRELWEHRGLYLAPLAMAGLAVVVFMMAGAGIGGHTEPVWTRDQMSHTEAMTTAFGLVEKMVMLTAFVVGVAYSADAIYGERRDRSVLFWKALPVSDPATVVGKACIPLVVLPLIGVIVTTIADATLLLGIGGLRLVANREWIGAWGGIWPPVFSIAAVTAARTLWLAPLYCWLLFVSGWARRVPLLWATLPWLALGLAEQFVGRTSVISAVLSHSGLAWLRHAFRLESRVTIPGVPMVDVTAQSFLREPGLWLGLAFAAACLAAAARVRGRSVPL